MDTRRRACRGREAGPLLVAIACLLLAGCSDVPVSSNNAAEADASVSEPVQLLTFDATRCRVRDGSTAPCDSFPYLDSAQGLPASHHVEVGESEDWPLGPTPTTGAAATLVHGFLVDVGADGGCARPVATDAGGGLTLATRSRWEAVFANGASRYTAALPATSSSVGCQSALIDAPWSQPPALLPFVPPAAASTFDSTWHTFVDWLLEPPVPPSGHCASGRKVNATRCWPSVFSYHLFFHQPADGKVDLPAILSTYSPAYDAIFDGRPFPMWTTTVAAPGFAFDPSTWSSRADEANEPLGRFLDLAGKAKRMPMVVALRTRAETSNELVATITAARDRAAQAGWNQVYPWGREVHVQSVAVAAPGTTPGTAVNPSDTATWRRSLLILAASLRRYHNDGEEVESYGLGTLTKTRAPGGSGFAPAELTTSGMQDQQGPTRWRAAAWQLFTFHFELFLVYTKLPFPICFHGNVCGQFYTAFEANPPAQMRKVLAIESAAAASPSQQLAIATIERCVTNDGTARNCFDRATDFTPYWPARAPRRRDGSAATRLIRMMVVNEADSATRAAAPAPTTTRVRVTLPPGISQAVARWSILPPPHETFDVPSMSSPVTVEVQGQQAEFDVPTTQPGAAMVEIAF